MWKCPRGDPIRKKYLQAIHSKIEKVRKITEKIKTMRQAFR